MSLNINIGETPTPSATQPPAEASFTVIETSDVFLQAQALPKWHQEYLQISEGAFHGSLSDISLGPIQLFRERMDKAVDQQGQPWPNSFVVGIPVNIEGEGFWSGDKLVSDSLFFLKPNSELRFRTPSSSDIYVAVLDLNALNQYIEDFTEINVQHLYQLSGVAPASQQLCQSLRYSLHHIFEGVSNNPYSLNDTRVRQVLFSDIMNTLIVGLETLGHVQPGNPGQFVHRHIVEKAREYMLSNKHLPPTVLEVCQELRISRRTLHYAFQKVLSISPVAFLRYIRLHGARQELLTTPPGRVLISEVAARWGFWHMGMFGTYYKALFGETPSVTLRRGLRPG
ncbi:transcriptional regulator, AraC family [Halopseudomonas litoralis]|uniref:Transcriptional regulator, AraC family n=2 Tax=Halopseudomonas litoralis TaxID=797277 RepID=A0A1H1LT35_9GAMM|nr:transcriptional regulator, AraC family [Halopseudomonas litoralis]